MKHWKLIAGWMLIGVAGRIAGNGMQSPVGGGVGINAAACGYYRESDFAGCAGLS